MIEETPKNVKDIVTKIAEKPGQSTQKLARHLHLDRITVARVLKGQDLKCIKGLVKSEIVKLESGKHSSESSFLTFKGILYALNIKAISADLAAKYRQGNKAELPARPQGTELAKLFGFSDMTPSISTHEFFSHKQLRKLGRVFPFGVSDDFLKVSKEHTEKMQATIDLILAKSGQKESILSQAIERKYSTQIYGILHRTVNIDSYEPLLVGYQYHNLMNTCYMEFVTNVFMGRKTDAIEAYIEMLKQDSVGLEIQQKAVLPFLAAETRLPSDLRATYSRLSKTSPNTLFESLRKLLQEK
jgi:hypothetical protein